MQLWLLQSMHLSWDGVGIEVLRRPRLGPFFDGLLDSDPCEELSSLQFQLLSGMEAAWLGCLQSLSELSAFV